MNKNGMAKSGAFIFQRSVREKVDTRKLHAKSTITGKIYQNNIIAENDTILSTNPFIPPAITILHQRYTDVSFRLNICAKSPFACFSYKNGLLIKPFSKRGLTYRGHLFLNVFISFSSRIVSYFYYNGFRTKNVDSG